MRTRYLWNQALVLEVTTNDGYTPTPILSLNRKFLEHNETCQMLVLQCCFASVIQKSAYELQVHKHDGLISASHQKSKDLNRIHDFNLRYM